MGKFAGAVHKRWVRVAPVGGCGWHRRPGRGPVWARGGGAAACAGVRRRAPARTRMRACAPACARPAGPRYLSSQVAPLYSGAQGWSPDEAESPRAPRLGKKSPRAPRLGKKNLKSYLTLSVRYDFRFFRIAIDFATVVPSATRPHRATDPGLRNRAAQLVTTNSAARPGVRTPARMRACACAPAHAGARRGAAASGAHRATPRAPVPPAPTHRIDSDPPFMHGSGKFAHPSHFLCTAPANLPTHRTFYARLLQICLTIAAFLHGSCKFGCPLHLLCTYLRPLLHTHTRLAAARGYPPSARAHSHSHGPVDTVPPPFTRALAALGARCAQCARRSASPGRAPFGSSPQLQATAQEIGRAHV